MDGEQESRVISFPFDEKADEAFRQMRPDIVVPENLRNIKDPFSFVMDNVASYR